MANDNNNQSFGPDFKAQLIIASPPLPTMMIASDETDLGYMIINKSDFDALTMAEYVDEHLPTIAQLSGALAAMTTTDDVLAMQRRDGRKTAAPLYAARLAALAT